MFAKAITVLAALGAVSAQRPSSTSICDYYSMAALKKVDAASEATLLTLLVNTVVIGNYSAAALPGKAVPGILAPGKVNGTDVNLLPYFDAGTASTNRGGKDGVAVSFLDGGGAAPLLMNMPAWENATLSNQYTLLTHLYQFFGTLLGCTAQGSSAFPAYSGDASQYEVHKFMDLDKYQVYYFIEQVGLAAASFGVADSDIAAVAMALENLFYYRCSPPTTVIPAQGPALQAICIADNCPIAPTGATCAAYAAATQPAVGIPSLAGGQANTMFTGSVLTGSAAIAGNTAPATMGSASATATGSAAATTSAPAIATGAANHMIPGMAAGALALAAFAL